MSTATDVYANAVEPLPPSEQLRLASMILQGLAQNSADVLDYRDDWSAEDISDVTLFSAQHASDQPGAE